MIVKYLPAIKSSLIIQTSRHRAGFVTRNCIMACDNTTTKHTLVKSHKSAVVIIPPENVWEQIQAIRRVHDKAYNRWMPHINLVYPFVPDVDDGIAFLDAATKIEKALSSLEPFTVCFTAESLKYFRHRKNCSLWLKPLPSVRNVGGLQTEYKTSQRYTESKDKDGSLDDDTSPGTAAKYTNTKTSTATARKMETLEDDIGEMYDRLVNLQQTVEAQFPGFQDLSNISERGFTPHLSLGQFSPKQVNTYRKQFAEKWSDVEFEVDRVHLISRKDFSDPFHIRQSVRIGQK